MNVHRPELSRLSEVLRDEYEGSPRGEKMTALHLFGIVHAGELAVLSGTDLAALATEAGLSVSFATELRKMVKLARFVQVKDVTKASEEPLSALFKRVSRPFPPGYSFDREEANAR